MKKNLGAISGKMIDKLNPVGKTCDCQFYQGQSCGKCSKTTHTPGPWTQEGWTIKANGHDPLRGWIADVAHTDKANSEDEANARLIAAAPELLAALKSQHSALLVKIYKGSSANEAMEFHRKSTPNCSSCAAIAKAEGR